MASNIPQVPDYVDEQDYEYILARYLGNVRDDVDKREGSIIWDSGAPLCIELAIAYLYVQVMVLNCFAASAPFPVFPAMFPAWFSSLDGSKAGAPTSGMEMFPMLAPCSYPHWAALVRSLYSIGLAILPAISLVCTVQST